MRYSVEKPGSPGELVHYGVKGMKWGVRKAYTDRRRQEVRTLKKVAKGDAPLLTRAATHLTTSGADIAKGGGLRGGAKVRAQNLEKHLNRINKGETKVKDLLELYSNINVSDVVSGIGNTSVSRKKAA